MEDQLNLENGIEELLFQLSAFNAECIDYLLRIKTPLRINLKYIKNSVSNYLGSINSNKLRKAYETFISAINEFLQVKKEIITENAVYTLDALARLIDTYNTINAATQNSFVDFPKLTDEDKRNFKQGLNDYFMLTILHTISDLFAYSIKHVSQKGSVGNHLINGTQKLIDMYNLLWGI